MDKVEGHWRRGESLPGLPAEHYGLFSDRLVPAELGEISEGWEVKELGGLLQPDDGPITAWQHLQRQWRRVTLLSRPYRLWLSLP